jgi:hypothetical protein
MSSTKRFKPRVYADVLETFPRDYWDYEAHELDWGYGWWNPSVDSGLSWLVLIRE